MQRYDLTKCDKEECVGVIRNNLFRDRFGTQKTHNSNPEKQRSKLMSQTILKAMVMKPDKLLCYQKQQ